jgi:hypothetical protein
MLLNKAQGGAMPILKRIWVVSPQFRYVTALSIDSELTDDDSAIGA